MWGRAVLNHEVVRRNEGPQLFQEYPGLKDHFAALGFTPETATWGKISSIIIFLTADADFYELLKRAPRVWISSSGSL
jgi:hypothetical protein